MRQSLFALPSPPGLIKLLNGQIIVTATNSLLAKTAAISQLCWSLTSGQFWGRILKLETTAMFFSSFQTAILLQQAKWKGCHFVSEVGVSSGPRLQVVRFGTFGTLVCTDRADKSVELQTRCRHDHQIYLWWGRGAGGTSIRWYQFPKAFYLLDSSLLGCWY